MSKSSSASFDDMESIFGRSVEIIRSVLFSCYRLSEEEVRGAEEDLRSWFQRFTRRGASAPPSKVLQMSLLSAACQYGRSLQFWKLGGAVSPDEALNAVLALQPEEVARDAQRRFEAERS